MKKYNEFVLKKLNEEFEFLLEGSLYASSDFQRKLLELSMSSGKVAEIAKFIRKFIENGIDIGDDLITQNFFDTTDKVDMVSFTMNNKVPEDWDPDDEPDLPYNLGRSEMKIGRVLRSIVNTINSDVAEMYRISITDKDVEDFVNAYKSLESSSNWEFRLVKGDDISKYYNKKNYLNENGSLGGSCMAAMKKRTFDIYTQNDDKVRLLILVDKKTDVICGRALVWKLKKSPCDAKFFMDRVYTNNDSDVLKFKKFANENKFLYKQKMNSQIETNVCFMYNGSEVFGEITVKLNNTDLSKYPFVDTLCFLKGNTLSNLPSKNCDWLHETDGGSDPCYECDGKCFTSSFLVRYNRICDVCGDGHIFLKRKGIETKINKKEDLL